MYDASRFYDDKNNTAHGQIHLKSTTGLIMEQHTDLLDALALDDYAHEPLDLHGTWGFAPQQERHADSHKRHHAYPHELHAHPRKLNSHPYELHAASPHELHSHPHELYAASPHELHSHPIELHASQPHEPYPHELHAATTFNHPHDTSHSISSDSHFPGAAAAYPAPPVAAPTTSVADGTCSADPAVPSAYRNMRKRGLELQEEVGSSTGADALISAESQTACVPAAPDEAAPNGDGMNAPIIESFETAMTVSNIRDVETYLSIRGIMAEASNGCLTNSPCDYASLRQYMLRAEDYNGWMVVTGVMNGTIVTPPTHCAPLPWVKSNLLDVLFSESEVLALGMLPLIRLACKEDTAKIITRSLVCDDEPRLHVFHIFDSGTQLAITNRFYTAYRWRTKSGELRNLVLGTSKVVNGSVLPNPPARFNIPVLRVCVNWERSANLDDKAKLLSTECAASNSHPHVQQGAAQQAIVYDHGADQVLSVFLVALLGPERVLGFSHDDLFGINLAESGPFINVDWRDLLITCENSDDNEGKSSPLRFVVTDVRNHLAIAELALLGIDRALKQFGGPHRSTFSLYPDIATIAILRVTKLGRKICRHHVGANEGPVIVI